MFRRPKPGESEEDLLEFQKQFLAKNSTPSVCVVSKAGEKRKTDETLVNRDVVKMEGMPSKVAGSDQVPPVKKSRFKACQEKKARTQTSSPDESGGPTDVHDTSTGTVLSKIIERDTRCAQYSLPIPMSQAFPSVVSASTTSQSVRTGKKKSVFAQQFEARPDVFGVKRDTLLSVNTGREQSSETGANTGFCVSGVIDGSGLSATFGTAEAQKIHEENTQKLTAMSQEEVVIEQKKLLQILDPKLVDFLKTRKARHVENTAEQTVEDEKEYKTGKHEKKQKFRETKEEIPVKVKKDWVHMDKIEFDKLEWMKDLPAPSAGDSKTGQQARFDFHGKLIPPWADVPVNIGLHHHGDEPERAGYTLEELFILARSSNIQQRSLALNTLARVINQAKAGNLSELVQSPILPSVLDAGVVFLLRWSMDDSVDSVVGAAVSLLNALLVNQADELALDKTFHWHEGHRVVCQVPALPPSVGIKLPDVSDEKPQETDADVIKHDLIKGLVYRMNLLPRVRFILEKVRPQAPIVVEILQILIRLARHSTQLAYEVFNHKGLMKLVLDNFLPLSWNITDVTQSLSIVYGVPLAVAMKFVRTLCQAGKHIAAVMLSEHKLESTLLRYLADEPRNLQLPESEALGLQIESWNTWKTCLSYGLADNIYIELYPKVVDHLRESSEVLYKAEDEQVRLAAVLGALEMVVCVASTPKTQGFRHRQDGEDIEMERSESVAQPVLNWSHVEGLLQPISLILKSVLAEIATNYQIKKPHLHVPSSCLNFVATYYMKSQTQQSGPDPVARLDDVKNMYMECMQHWNSFGLKTIRSRLSQHSNILQPIESRNTEQHPSLPEYGNTSVKEHSHLPIVTLHSPFNFMSSLLRMILALVKIHKGLLMSKNQDPADKCTPPVSCVLSCPDALTYLRKVSLGTPSCLSGNYFTKFENHLQYYILKVATVQANQMDLSAEDRSILHCVALCLLTGLHHGDEHLIHDLMSTCSFSPVYWRQGKDESVAAGLGELSLSATPTHLRSATEKEVSFTLQQLSVDAQAHLTDIRSTYLMAFSQSETEVIKSRNHFSQLTHLSETCFTSSTGECLLPKDWMFVPLIELYNTYMSVGAEVQNVLSAAQLDVVRNVLRWIFLMEVERPALLGHVSVTLRLSRIMCVFLTGNDMFLDHTVHCYMAGLLHYYTKPNILEKIDFTETIPGLTSFYDLYTGLLQQYEAVSFGDSLFGCYILLPLQQKHSLQYRRAVWTEYTGLLRTLSVSVVELLIPIKEYLEPEEVDVGLIRLYFQSLYSHTLRPTWSPVLYLMAVHHINRFIYTQDGHHKNLKDKMLLSLMSLKHEELKQHVLYYKTADVTLQFGMEMYKDLPLIRQKYLDTVKGNK